MNVVSLNPPTAPRAKLYGEPVIELPHDLYIPPDALEIILEAFEGPLDLLLALARDLPQSFVKLREALKPLVGGDLAHVVYVSYANPTLADGAPCPAGRSRPRRARPVRRRSCSCLLTGPPSSDCAPAPESPRSAWSGSTPC